MKKKIFYRVNEFREEVEHLYETGITRGAYVGFETLHEYFSLKMGATTYIYGAPFSGKTEFWLDVLVTLSELYGYRHVLYTPETGNRQQIVGELISKKCRKPFYKQFQGHVNDKEYWEAIDWVNEYFFIVDPEEEVTVDDFYKAVDEIEKEYSVKVHTTMCDPFNELKHSLKDDDGRQDLYIENKLGFIRRNAQKHERHNAIITHVGQQELSKGRNAKGEEGVFYKPAMPQQIAGGQAWYRKAMNLISVYRPPFGFIDPNTGAPYEENETQIIIQKFKPKGTGKRGTVKLYFDIQQNRYYEKINGDKRYAGKQLTPMAQLQSIDYDF